MSTSTKWFLVVLGVLALIAIGFVVLFLALSSMLTTDVATETVVSGSGDKIAVVELKGVISSSDEIVRQLKKYRENKGIRAILLRVDSPGGGVVASQEMYEEVKKTRDGGKPVVVSMGSLAASGGYYVSCGASRLVANRGTLTGSIGVISEFLQLQGAMDKLGVGIKTIKAGSLKDAGSPVRPMNDADQKYFQGLMDDVHRQFIAVVESERKIPHDQVLAIADGRVFTGEQALPLHLIDTLGTYEDAVRITAGLAGIKGEPALVRERYRRSWFQSFFGDAGETLKDIKQELLDRPVLSFRFNQP
ncbi:MAG TPA: signal peptide peptidase SppA [Bacteroidota bacterium]